MRSGALHCLDLRAVLREDCALRSVAGRVAHAGCAYDALWLGDSQTVSCGDDGSLALADQQCACIFASVVVFVCACNTADTWILCVPLSLLFSPVLCTLSLTLVLYVYVPVTLVID